MTKFKEWNLESNVDVFVGGTPCQSFSVAGLRKGLDDPRGNLMLVFLAIAKQYRPNWLVWENVPGVLSSADGRDFGSFLGGLAVLGYGFAYRVLDAQYFGVAQRRRRVFVVGYLGDWRPAAAVLFERHSLQGNPAPSREKREEPAKCLTRGAGQRYDFETEDLIPQPIPIDSMNHIGRGDKHSMGDFVAGAPSYTLTKGHSHAVAQPIALAENTIGRKPENGGNGDGFTDGGPMYTLNATGVHGVAQPLPFGVSEKPDVGHCLRSGASKADKHESTTYVAQPIAFSGKMSNPQTDVDMTQTLGAKNPMAVAVGTDCYSGTITGDITMTLKRGDGNPAINQPTVLQAMAVRRLTPVECERLQGFPDRYTDIQPKGKATPDGPRYKALGNSMAVPVMAWIGKRIQEVDAICKTQQKQ